MVSHCAGSGPHRALGAGGVGGEGGACRGIRLLLVGLSLEAQCTVPGSLAGLRVLSIFLLEFGLVWRRGLVGGLGLSLVVVVPLLGLGDLRRAFPRWRQGLSPPAAGPLEPWQALIVLGEPWQALVVLEELWQACGVAAVVVPWPALVVLEPWQALEAGAEEGRTGSSAG